jgi:hypothetical protein
MPQREGRFLQTQFMRVSRKQHTPPLASRARTPATFASALSGAWSSLRPARSGGSQRRISTRLSFVKMMKASAASRGARLMHPAFDKSLRDISGEPWIDNSFPRLIQ